MMYQVHDSVPNTIRMIYGVAADLQVPYRWPQRYSSASRAIWRNLEELEHLVKRAKREFHDFNNSAWVGG